MQTNNIISNIVCQEKNTKGFFEKISKIIFGEEKENKIIDNIIPLFSGESIRKNDKSDSVVSKLDYTKYNSRIPAISDGRKCTNASFKIDKLNHEKIEKDKLKVYFLTLPETDHRIGVTKHSKNVDRFMRIAKKKFGIKATARAKEHSSTGQIHSHFIIISETMTAEVTKIWQKISGVAIAEQEEMYYFTGLRQYVCKKNEKNEEKIPVSEKIRQKFSFSQTFKNYLAEQKITINNGYRNIGTIIFSNDSVKVELLKTKKSKAIDENFAEFLQPFKKTLKFRTNDIYGFTALNEKENFIKFFELERKLIWYPETLYFISVNGQFKLTYFTEYLENKMIG